MLKLGLIVWYKLGWSLGQRWGADLQGFERKGPVESVIPARSRPSASMDLGLFSLDLSCKDFSMIISSQLTENQLE